MLLLPSLDFNLGVLARPNQWNLASWRSFFYPWWRFTGFTKRALLARLIRISLSVLALNFVGHARLVLVFRTGFEKVDVLLQPRSLLYPPKRSRNLCRRGPKFGSELLVCILKSEYEIGLFRPYWICLENSSIANQKITTETPRGHAKLVTPKVSTEVLSVLQYDTNDYRRSSF